MEQVQENKMGTMPVGPLLLNVSIPIVISMFVQALYNVVDSIFVAKLGEDALTAVSLVFPIQNLMIAVAVGTGVGINSILSRRLGEKNFDSANKTAGNGIFLTLLNWVGFVLFGLFFTRSFFAGYASHPEIGGAVAEMGASYMYIVTIASLGIFVSITMERLLQSTGRTIYSMISQMVGALVNIVLDPIMIFGLLGFPAWGVEGAAIATVIGQTVSMLLGIYFNFAFNKEIRITLASIRPDWNTIKNIYVVGLPSIVMQSIGSVMVFGLNKILVAFGSAPVSVLGIYFRLQSFVLMPLLGFNNGMVPIIAYNYGAGKPARIEETLRLTLKIFFGIMFAGMALFWLIPQPMLMIFDASPSMIEVGTRALRVISISFIFAPVSILSIGMFQALGEGVYSLIMAIVRQLLLILPVAWLLAELYGLEGVWFAFPIAECFSFVLAICFYRRVWNKKVTPLKNTK